MQRKDGGARLRHILPIPSSPERIAIVDRSYSPTSPLSAAPSPVARASARAALSGGEWQQLLGGAPLNPDELSALNRMAHLLRLPAGAPVFGREQPALDLVAVLKGTVSLGQCREGQDFDLERSVQGPAWLDLSSAWLGQCHDRDARCLSEARVLALPLAEMRALLARQAAMPERLLLGLARSVHRLNSATHELMHMDAEKRLAAWLLRRGEGGGQGGALLQLTERKRDIAAQLAITPETLSRMLRQLRLKGLIEGQGYALRLTDTQALARLAGE